jgi:hypothetical protein
VGYVDFKGVVGELPPIRGDEKGVGKGEV